MTKKDYVVIAHAINQALLLRDEHEALQMASAILDVLIPMLKADNHNFDPQRFKEAVFRGYQ